jgi:hypothetical protein
LVSVVSVVPARVLDRLVARAAADVADVLLAACRAAFPGVLPPASRVRLAARLVEVDVAYPFRVPLAGGAVCAGLALSVADGRLAAFFAACSP